MIGFVYSLPGIKDGKATQWSHMAGGVAEEQSRGIGMQLKLLQRERALSAGLDLVQWTYDPLQAMNAHLNFSKLGVVVDVGQPRDQQALAQSVVRDRPDEPFHPAVLLPG